VFREWVSLSNITSCHSEPAFFAGEESAVGTLPRPPRFSTDGVRYGEAGIDRAVEILRTDVERTLRLLGCPSVAELDRSYVNVPKNWEAS
jgi:hypothetical protein